MIHTPRQWSNVWSQAHQMLVKYLPGSLSSDTRVRLASAACGYWVQNACDGTPTTDGPYAALLKVAWDLMLRYDGMEVSLSSTAPPNYAIEPSSTLPYNLSYCYCRCWHACELCKYDRTAVHRMAKAAARVQPLGDGQWIRVVSSSAIDLARAAGARAIDVVESHRCSGCRTCGDFGARWDYEDTATAAYLARIVAEKEVK